MLHLSKRETTFNKIRELRVYIESIDEKSPFVYTSVVFLFDETLMKSFGVCKVCDSVFEFISR